MIREREYTLRHAPVLVVEMELRGDDEAAPSGLGVRPAVVLMSNVRRVRVCGIQRCQSL